MSAGVHACAWVQNAALCPCLAAAGTSVWPGANFVVHPDGEKTFLKFGDRRKIAADLKVKASSAHSGALMFVRCHVCTMWL